MYTIAVFQQLEVDYIIGHPNKDVHVTDLTEVPIIRMYGVTESGTQDPTASARQFPDKLQLEQIYHLQLATVKQ